MTTERGYFDISPRITKDIGVFPGDVKFVREVSLDFEKGHHLLLSSIHSTLHLGAHADGPNHYQPGETGIGERDLEFYMGRAQVIHARVARGERILPKHIDETRILAPRVLFYTGTFPDPDRWNSDFAALSPELVDLLAIQGVKLVGIDTPSVDPEASKILESHTRIAHHGLAILEGLVLENVPEGIYTLIALPLPLTGADASPVRAVLLRDLTVLER